MAATRSVCLGPSSVHPLAEQRAGLSVCKFQETASIWRHREQALRCSIRHQLAVAPDAEVTPLRAALCGERCLGRDSAERRKLASALSSEHERAERGARASTAARGPRRLRRDLHRRWLRFIGSCLSPPKYNREFYINWGINNAFLSSATSAGFHGRPRWHRPRCQVRQAHRAPHQVFI